MIVTNGSKKKNYKQCAYLHLAPYNNDSSYDSYILLHYILFQIFYDLLELPSVHLLKIKVA